MSLTQFCILYVGVHSGVCFLFLGAKLDAVFTYGGSTIRICRVGGPSTQSAVPQQSHLYGGAYSFGGSAESHPIPLPSLHDGEGSSFPGLVPSDDTVVSESVMGINTEQLISHLWVALVDLSHCLSPREVLYLCLKCVSYISGFMTFWTRLFPSRLETWLAF